MADPNDPHGHLNPFTMQAQDLSDLSALPPLVQVGTPPPLAQAVADPVTIPDPGPVGPQAVGMDGRTLTQADLQADRDAAAAATAALRAQAEQGFTGAESPSGDTVGFEPAGAAASLSEQQGSALAQPQRTPEQQALADFALEQAQQTGRPGDGGARTRALLGGRAGGAAQALEQSARRAEDARTQADITQAALAEAQMEQMERESAQQLALVDRAEDNARRLAADRADADRASAAQQANLAQVAESIAAETEAIGQEQVRDRRTVGQKTLATIAVAMGEIGKALQQSFGENPNATNSALEVVNRQIEQDIDNQVQALQRRQTALAARGRQYDRLGAVYQDADARRMASLSLKTGEYEGEVARMAARHAGTNKGEQAGLLGLALQAQREEQAATAAGLEAQARADALRAADEAVFADELKRAGRAERGSRNRRAEKVKDQLATEGVKQLAAGVEVSPERERLSREIATPGGLVPLRNQQGGMGPANKKQADEAFDSQKQFANYRALTGEIRTLAKAGTTMSPTARVKAQAVIQSLTAAESVMLGQGAMTDDEYARKVERAMVNPTEATIADALEAIDHREQVAGRMLNKQLEGTNTALPDVSTGDRDGASADELEATRR